MISIRSIDVTNVYDSIVTSTFRSLHRRLGRHWLAEDARLGDAAAVPVPRYTTDLADLPRRAASSAPAGMQAMPLRGGWAPVAITASLGACGSCR